MMICDFIASCVKKTATCQPCLNVTCANSNDVVIVGIICATILIIALVGIIGYFTMKASERKASADEAKKKRDNDVEDRKWKLSIDKEAHVLKRNEDKEDHERKRKEEQEDHTMKRTVDLEDKLLCLLKDLAEIERDTAGEEIKKYNDESKAYKAMLEKMIYELSSNIIKANDKEA